MPAGPPPTMQQRVRAVCVPMSSMLAFVAVQLGAGRSRRGASEQIVEAADTVPAVAVALELHAVNALVVDAAVVARQQVDQHAALAVRLLAGEAHFAGIGAHVVQE